ncbi:MAG: hypothetical protein G3M70_03475 [Candidatus Nitronauta litoralis]|uniref:NHL repeat-containing protein n=1 Tax=Candidatus Nitronauta litoralis TaxID=2705533 RepID=A0A7T0BU04_9BACT|nr:MAG: hypothetical protein G3M70_03475 [Candidatus Nitronauta litoralis]
MTHPSKRLKNLSPEEIATLFLSEFASSTTSKEARAFLGAFREKVSASDFPPERMDDAKKVLKSLNDLFVVETPEPFCRKVEGGLKPSPPSGMTWAPDGGLIIADDFNHRIQVYDANHSLKIQFGSKGKNPGEFQYPKGIALDPAGHLYVADGWNHRVQKFDLEGNFIGAFGEFGEGPGQMNEPWDVLVDSTGRIVVVERYNHRLQFFDSDGNSLGWTGQRATVFEDQLAFIYETSAALAPRPALEFPTCLDEDSLGNFFLTDSANHRILKFDSEWNLIKSFGSQGDRPGQFQYPLSLSIDDGGLLYVADLNNNRIQKFTGEGVFIEAFSEGQGGAALKMPGLVLAGKDGALVIALTLDATLHRFQSPTLTSDKTYQALSALQPDSAEIRLSHSHHLEDSGHREAALNLCQQTLDLTATKPLSKEAETLPATWSNLASKVESTEPLLGTLIQLGLIHANRRGHLLKQFQEWTDFLPSYCGRLVEEQNNILNHNEDPLEFDRELFNMKSQDKALFRSTRLAMVEYRESVARLENAFRETLLLPLEDPFLIPLMAQIKQEFEDVGELLVQLLKRKEQSETFLIKTLQDERGAQEHWAEFVANHSISNRISEQVRQLIVEFLAHARLLDTAAKRFSNCKPVTETLRSTLWNEGTVNLFGQVLLGFQEDPDLVAHMQGIFMGLLDGWKTQTENDGPPVASFSTEDIAAFEFDREELSPAELTRSYRIGGSPIKIQPDGVLLGGELYPVGLVAGKESDVGAKLESILQNQSVYSEKIIDVLKQSGDLRKQKLELETRLHSVDVRDKATPVQIGNNVRVIDFQINLLQRMNQTLAVNEMNNLVRLVIGAALLASTDAGKAILAGLDLPSSINKLVQSELQQLHQLKQEWKEVGLFHAGLQGRLAGISNELEPEKVKEIEALQNQVAKSDFNYLQKTATVYRQANLTGLLQKLDDALNPEATAESAPTFSHYVGSFGHADSGFLYPFGAAHLKNGELLATDNKKHCVMRFSSEGVYQGNFGRFGNGPGALNSPFGIAVSPDQTVYVADNGNRRITAFDANGHFLNSLGNTGPEENRIGLAYSVAVDSENNVWVPDTEKNRIQVFSSSGELQKVFGKENDTATDLDNPTAVCPLDDGGFIVSDRSEYILKRFDKDGGLVTSVDTTQATLGEAYSLVHHPDHGLFVSDTFNCQILCLDLDLNVKWVHNQTGRRGGQVFRIGGLSISNNQLFVADYDNIRVQVFDLI